MASNLIDSIMLAYGTSLRVYDDHIELLDEHGTIDLTHGVEQLEKLYWALQEVMKKYGIVVEF